MIRLLQLEDSPDGASAFYRSVLPFRHLRRQVEGLEIEIQMERNGPLGWSVLTGFDVLFVPNPRSTRAKEILRQARMCGLKIWIDYDDLYLAIPPENPSYSRFRANHAAHNTVDCLLAADVVTVSTKYLAESYRKYNSNVHVVPNAFPVDLLVEGALGSIVQGRHEFVTWRGAEQHQRNLREFSAELAAVANDMRQRWTFQFFGMNPEFFDGLFAYNHYGFDELVSSLYRMKRFCSKVHLVTLYDAPFNRAKSNISWIEGTIAGSVVLAPDWEEWTLPGVINYRNREEFQCQLRKLLGGEYDLSAHFEASRDYLIRNLDLRTVNRGRLTILTGLVPDRAPIRLPASGL